DDGGQTWINRDTGPAGTDPHSVKKFVVFKGDVYAMVTTTATGQVGIYRTPNTPAEPSSWGPWSDELVATPPGIEGKSTIFNAGTEYLFYGEYEANGQDIAALGGPLLLRSPDGDTWEPVWGRDPSVKHIHGVYEDPYHPGHIYMTLGDTGTPHSVLRSKQHGAPGTWEPIITGGNNNWQSVQISFTQDHVWLSSDRVGFTVAIFDRDELVPRSAAFGEPYMMPVPGGEVGDRFYQLGYLGAVDPETGIYYHNQSDTSTPGNTFANFVLPRIGGRLELLDFGKGGTGGWNANGEVYIAHGNVYIGNMILPAWRP
ncbi:MAG TPA: hypothetical protein VK053_05490, partial [Jiangellaceae bacterium]|nr:hypothetical protein [Jiangellaceae bacterium]